MVVPRRRDVLKKSFLNQFMCASGYRTTRGTSVMYMTPTGWPKWFVRGSSRDGLTRVELAGLQTELRTELAWLLYLVRNHTNVALTHQSPPRKPPSSKRMLLTIQPSLYVPLFALSLTYIKCTFSGVKLIAQKTAWQI